MLSSVRPLTRQEDSRRPVWEFADRVQITQWHARIACDFSIGDGCRLGRLW